MAKKKKREPSVRLLRTILPDGTVVLPRKTISVSTYTVKRGKRATVTKGVGQRKITVETATNTSPPVPPNGFHHDDLEPMQIDDNDVDPRNPDDEPELARKKKHTSIGVCTNFHSAPFQRN